VPKQTLRKTTMHDDESTDIRRYCGDNPLRHLLHVSTYTRQLYQSSRSYGVVQIKTMSVPHSARFREDHNAESRVFSVQTPTQFRYSVYRNR